jgi:hypothetical protein
MNLQLRFRERIREVGGSPLEDEFDQMMGEISAGFGTEHDVASGAHNAVTVQSLAARSGLDTESVIQVISGLRYTKGPWLIGAAGQGTATGNGFIVPPTLTANVNNYAPSGIDTAIGIILSPQTDNRSITGIKIAASEYRILFLTNVSSNYVILKSESTSSRDIHRFRMGGRGDNDYAIGYNQTVILIYNTYLSRWCVIGSSQAQGFVEAYRATNQAIANTTLTKVQYDTEQYDSSSGISAYDPTTNYRYTCSMGGNYRISGQIAWAAPAARCQGQVYIYVNGAARSQSNVELVPTMVIANPYNRIFRLAAADYVEVWCQQNSGGLLNVTAGIDQSFLNIELQP